MELKTLELTDNPDEIILYWTEFNIHVLTPNAYNVAQLIRTNFQKYSCGFPEEYQIQLKINDPSRLPELQPIEYPPAGGFRFTYAARCNQFLLPVSEPLVIVVEELAAKGDRTLNLTVVPGIETLDLRPLTAALLHNVYFIGLQLSNVARPTALQEFCSLVATNRTIMELTLENTNPVKGSVALLGDSLVKNPFPSLEVLNLKQDKISDEEGMRLGLGLAAYKHFLTGLDVTACGLSNRGVIGLFAGLAANRNICTYLRVLNCSFNKLSGNRDTITELARFFDRYAVGSEARSLEVLNMRECQLDQVVVSALVRREGVIATLKEIDLSGNNLGGPIGPSLVAMAKDSQCLKRIKLSNCKLDALTVQDFLKGLSTNDFLDELELDMSHNTLRIHGADAIDKGLKGHVDKVKALNLFNCALGDDGLQVLVKVFEASNRLIELDIGGNITKTKGGGGMQGCLTALSMFVTKHPSLQVFNLGGCSASQSYMGKYIGPLLAVFSHTRNIDVLDVSGNLMGDDAFIILVDALRQNTSMRSLYWDENRTTPASWSALVRTLKENTTLQHVEFPTKDVEVFAPRGRRGDRQRTVAESLMTDVAKLLNRNRAHQGAAPRGNTMRRVRGQTFAEGLQAEQSPGVGKPPRSDMPPKSPRAGTVGVAPLGSYDETNVAQLPGAMKAPPKLQEAYPEGSPLEREQRRREAQEAALAEQRAREQAAAQKAARQAVEPPVRKDLPPPPSMAQFQAQRQAQQPSFNRVPTGPIGHPYGGAPPQYGSPQYGGGVGVSPYNSPGQQPRAYAQPQVTPQQQQQPYYPPQQQQGQQQYYQQQGYDETEYSMDDLPPPPPIADAGYQYTEDYPPNY